jgi:hypothetical protein
MHLKEVAQGPFCPFGDLYMYKFQGQTLTMCRKEKVHASLNHEAYNTAIFVLFKGCA